MHTRMRIYEYVARRPGAAYISFLLWRKQKIGSPRANIQVRAGLRGEPDDVNRYVKKMYEAYEAYDVCYEACYGAMWS
jgi:hypothetical protein